MDSKQIVMNAIDSSGFIPSDTEAGYINPTLWNKQVLDFVQEALVVSKLGKVYDDLLGSPGATLNITVNSAPAAASATATTDDASVSAYVVTQVVFTPSEYTFRYQLHDTEARRAFYSVQMDMSRKIGYALALAMDDDAVTTTTAGAGNSYLSNGKTATTDLASTDLIDFADIVEAATLIRADKLFPTALVVSAGQMGDLSKDTTFATTLPQGGNFNNVLGGKIGRIYGMDVYWTTQIAPSSSVSKALMFGVDSSGEPAFGVARKSLPEVRTQYFAAGRYLDIVGAAEWDTQVLRANGICWIASYDA